MDRSAICLHGLDPDGSLVADRAGGCLEDRGDTTITLAVTSLTSRGLLGTQASTCHTTFILGLISTHWLTDGGEVIKMFWPYWFGPRRRGLPGYWGGWGGPPWAYQQEQEQQQGEGEQYQQYPNPQYPMPGYFYPAPYPPVPYIPPSLEEELKMLEEYKKALEEDKKAIEEEIKGVEARINELKKALEKE